MSGEIEKVGRFIYDQLGNISMTDPNRRFLEGLYNLTTAYLGREANTSVGVRRGRDRLNTIDISGVRIKELREARDWSQKELTQSVSPITQGRIGQIERSDRIRITQSLASRIAQALDTTVESFTYTPTENS